MALSDKRQQLSTGKAAPLPAKPAPSKPASSPPKDTSVFGGRPHVRMDEVAWRLRKANPSVPGLSGMLSEKERISIGQDLNRKSGSYLKKGKLPQLYKDLEMEKSRAKTPDEKWRIEREIRVLKRELGS